MPDSRPAASSTSRASPEMTGTLTSPATAWRHRQRQGARWLWVIGVLVVLACLLDISQGSGQLTLARLLPALWQPQAADPLAHVILWQLRLPIALMAVVVGAALAMAGAQMQTLLHNPLADPFTLGVSAAASVGAGLGLILHFDLIPAGLAPLTFLNAAGLGVTLNAFVFALTASLILWSAQRLPGVGVQTLVLLGIALMFFFNALLGVLQFVASPEALQQLIFWSMGSLERSSWPRLGVLSAVILVCGVIFHRRRSELTALSLGETQARALGVDVRRLRLTGLLCTALLTATAVSFVGSVGFIGLVAPHIARLLVGEQQQRFLPLSALLGALLLSLTSTLSKSLIPDVLLPLGMITALIGLPFFVSLILKRRGLDG
ncbi:MULTISPECIES: FecCD family ABC transporter permease [Cobetia]|nr:MULTISPECIES: iron ABC transporter permease [Cobetia]